MVIKTISKSEYLSNDVIDLTRTGSYYPTFVDDVEKMKGLVEDRLFKEVKLNRVLFEITILDGKMASGKSTKLSYWKKRAIEIYKESGQDVNIHSLEKVQHLFYLFDDKPVQIFIIDDAMSAEHVFTDAYIAHIMETRHSYKKSKRKYFDLPHDPADSCNIMLWISIQNMFGLKPAIRRVGTSYDFNSIPGVKRHKIDLANDFITHQGFELLDDISFEVDQLDIDSSRGKSIFSGLNFAGLYFNENVTTEIKLTTVSDEIDTISEKLLNT